MKYILILLFFISCNNSNTIEISKDEYKKLKGDTIKPKYPKYFKLFYYNDLSYNNRNGIVLGSDNHEYLVTNYGGNAENIEHYIECEYCLNKNKK